MTRRWNKIIAQIVLMMMVFSAVSLPVSNSVQAEPLVTTEANLGVIPENTLRVHYHREDHNFQEMGLWLWGDVATSSGDAGEWPIGATAFNENQLTAYGAYVDINLREDANKVSFIVLNMSSEAKEANEKVVLITTPEINEVWIKEGSDEVFLWEPVFIPENTIRIHYQRADKDYNNWGLWMWDEIETPSDAVGSWPTGASAFSDAQVDKQGAYLDVKLKDKADKISFLVINRTDGAKDGAERSFAQLREYNHLFIKEGNPAVYTTPYVTAVEDSKANFPEWAKDSTLYEVNVRQFTPEGTFKAFEEHLPRLKKLGVEILWFMPIHPISEKNRIGSLGSYYAVNDYQAVNPEFGTLEDFRSLVDTAHNMGFKVMLDWVANHTGWDHQWLENDGWHTTDSEGKIVIPGGTDWQDVADLNFDNGDMRNAMIESMEYWVREFNVDGFRADYAAGVPQDFWETARIELDKIKPVYMLAEDDTQYGLLSEAFNSNYGWELFYDIMKGISSGEKGPKDIKSYIERSMQLYPKGSYPMNFITNHDTNSWEGTTSEMFGEAEKTMAVLSFTLPGMPLIYSGQEVGLDKRLAFFDKDEINWDDLSMQPFYEKLIHLKKRNAALWNGSEGGDVHFLPTNNPHVLAFEREKNGSKVVSVLNLSAENVSAAVNADSSAGTYVSYLDNTTFDFNQEQIFDLAPWEYQIFTNITEDNTLPNPEPITEPNNGSNTGNVTVPNVAKTKGSVTFNADSLKNGSSDTVTLTVDADTEQVLLPIQAAELMGKKSITIEFNKVSIELPSEVLLEAQSLASGVPEDQAHISLSVVPLKEALEEALLAVNHNANTHIKMGSAIYEINLSVITEKKGSKSLTSFTKPITIAFKVDDGLNRDLAGVYFIGDNQKLEYAGGERVEGVMRVRVEHFSKYAVLEYDRIFHDVSALHGASLAIKSLAAKQIINGTTDITFEPSKKITRAEFSAMLVRSINIKAAGSSRFSDVSGDEWYARAITAAAEAGIINGRSEGIFAPKALITRQEMDIMIQRAYVFKNGNKEATGIVPMNSNVGEGFERKSLSTRAEAAQAIYSLLNN